MGAAVLAGCGSRDMAWLDNREWDSGPVNCPPVFIHNPAPVSVIVDVSGMSKMQPTRRSFVLHRKQWVAATSVSRSQHSRVRVFLASFQPIEDIEVGPVVFRQPMPPMAAVKPRCRTTRHRRKSSRGLRHRDEQSQADLSRPHRLIAACQSQLPNEHSGIGHYSRLQPCSTPTRQPIGAPERADGPILQARRVRGRELSGCRRLARASAAAGMIKAAPNE